MELKGPLDPQDQNTAPKSFLLQKNHAWVPAETSEEVDGFHTNSKQSKQLNGFLHLVQSSFLNITADYMSYIRLNK